eukprot:CFRG5302T1
MEAFDYQPHQYYSLLDSFASVRWHNDYGQFRNDINTGNLAITTNFLREVNETFDPDGTWTQFIVQRVAKMFAALGLDDTTPCQFVETVKVFVIVNIFTAVAWVAVKFLFDRTWPAFAAISPAHKKWYVVANLSKAFFLGMMVFSYSWWKYAYHAYFLNDRKLTHTIMYLCKFAGSMYVTTDFMALFMVPKLPQSTKIHHYVSTLLFFLVSMYDFNNADIVQMINLYGWFSTLAFSTNAFLALRVMYSKSHPGLMRLLAVYSFIVYFGSCAANWFCQGVWFASHIVHMSLNVPALFYALFLALVINDDIVLIKWLYKTGFEETPDVKKAQ